MRVVFVTCYKNTCQVVKKFGIHIVKMLHTTQSNSLAAAATIVYIFFTHIKLPIY